MYSAFSEFSSADTIRFFEENGVPLKTERGNRVFPQSDKAVDIVDALTAAARKAGVVFKQARVSELVVKENTIGGVKTEEGEFIAAIIVTVYKINIGGTTYYY